MFHRCLTTIQLLDFILFIQASIQLPEKSLLTEWSALSCDHSVHGNWMFPVTEGPITKYLLYNFTNHKNGRYLKTGLTCPYFQKAS